VRLELGVVLQGRVAGVVAQEGEHLLGIRRDLKDPFFDMTRNKMIFRVNTCG
jgi:hypothetical protein